MQNSRQQDCLSEIKPEHKIFSGGERSCLSLHLDRSKGLWEGPPDSISLKNLEESELAGFVTSNGDHLMTK